MRVAIVLTAVRIMDVGEPEEGQSKEEFLQICKEGTLSDPLSFIDAPGEQAEMVCSLAELK